MIERLLAADAALDRDDLDIAERLFGQVAEADPRNAIAVVGLARVAVKRNEPTEARSLARRALDIDPEEAAARRLLGELEARAATAAPAVAAPAVAPAVVPVAAPAAAAAVAAAAVAAPAPAVAAPVVAAVAPPRVAPRPARRRSWWRRIVRRFLRRR